MNSDANTPNASDQTPDWKGAICALLESLDEKVHEPQWMKGEWPTWAQRAMQEILKACFPDAQLKLGPSWTPRALGAVLGAKVGLLTWLKDDNGFAKSKGAGILENAFAKLTEEQKAAAEIEGSKFADGVAKYLEAFEGVQTRALALGGTAQTSDEQSEFFSAYVGAMKRAEKGLDVGSFGTTATPIYIFLALNWQAIARLPNIPAVHKVCAAAFGGNRVGDLKTFQQLCRRIGLRLRPPGRPGKQQ